MGTWALPNTKQKAEELQKLFEKPIYSNQMTKEKLYDLYGDDVLFDSINDREYEEDSKYDIRFLIATHIKGLLQYYNEKPECFNVKFNKSAIKILNKLLLNRGYNPLYFIMSE